MGISSSKLTMRYFSIFFRGVGFNHQLTNIFFHHWSVIFTTIPIIFMMNIQENHTNHQPTKSYMYVLIMTLIIKTLINQFLIFPELWTASCRNVVSFCSESALASTRWTSPCHGRGMAWTKNNKLISYEWEINTPKWLIYIS